MPARKDPVRVVSHVVAYAAFYLAPLVLGFGFLMQGLLGTLAGMTLGEPGGGVIRQLDRFEDFRRPPADGARAMVEPGRRRIILRWDCWEASARHASRLGPPLAAGAAHFARIPEEQPTIWAAVFLAVFLFVGSAAEEILFRGFGFPDAAGELRSLGRDRAHGRAVRVVAPGQSGGDMVGHR